MNLYSYISKLFISEFKFVKQQNKTTMIVRRQKEAYKKQIIDEIVTIAKSCKMITMSSFKLAKFINNMKIFTLNLFCKIKMKRVTKTTTRKRSAT